MPADRRRVLTAASGRPGPYRRLLAMPGSGRLAAADLCARLPQGMISITVLLVAAQHASMRVAGLALAGSTLGLAATAPVRGRLADRHGIVRTAAFCWGGYLAAWLGLLTASVARQPPVVLVALATATGCCTPPLSPGLRSLWSLQAPAELLQTAFALDAAVFDLAYIAGPMIASSLAVGIAPAAATAVLLALTGAAVVIVGRRFRRPPGPAAAAAGIGPLRSAALRQLLVTAALANAALSATEVALIAYVRLHDALWASGPLLAALSAGSILGSSAARHPGTGRQQPAAPDPAAGQLRPWPGRAGRRRAGTALDRGSHAAGGIVPGPDAGDVVHCGRRGRSRRPGHRGAVVAQLDDERRSRRRRGSRRNHRQPAGAWPGHSRGSSSRSGADGGHDAARRRCPAS